MFLVAWATGTFHYVSCLRVLNFDIVQHWNGFHGICLLFVGAVLWILHLDLSLSLRPRPRPYHSSDKTSREVCCSFVLHSNRWLMPIMLTWQHQLCIFYLSELSNISHNAIQESSGIWPISLMTQTSFQMSSENSQIFGKSVKRRNFERSLS